MALGQEKWREFAWVGLHRPICFVTRFDLRNTTFGKLLSIPCSIQLLFSSKDNLREAIFSMDKADSLIQKADKPNAKSRHPDAKSGQLEKVLTPL